MLERKRRKETSSGPAPLSGPVPLNDLIADLKGTFENAEEEIKAATPSADAATTVTAKASAAATTVPENNLDAIRRELIKSSEDGEIDQSVKYLQKASAKVIEKIHKQMEAKRLEKANAFITDMLLSRFADTLGGLDAIESSEELNNDLQKDKLLKRDIENIVAYATPFLPFLGLISGGLTTGKHVYTHCSKPVREDANANLKPVEDEKPNN